MSKTNTTTVTFEEIKNMIAETLAPCREQLTVKGVEILESQYRFYRSKFDAAGSLKAAFPIDYNSWNCREQRATQERARTLLGFYEKLMRPEQGPNAYTLAPWRLYTTEERDALNLKEAKENADALIEAYATKLAGKALQKAEGVEVASFEFVSAMTNPFHASVVKVTTVDGSSFKLSTKTIINCSKLGKLFNQFPTRKVK